MKKSFKLLNYFMMRCWQHTDKKIVPFKTLLLFIQSQKCWSEKDHIQFVWNDDVSVHFKAFISRGVFELQK